MILCCLAHAGCAGMDFSGSGKEQGMLAGGKPLTRLESQQLAAQTRLGKVEGVAVEPHLNSIIITIRCDMLFENDTPRLRPSVCGLDDLADMLRQFPETKVKVDAHTDCMRSEEENFLISELRAWAVKESMAAKGVDASRITARGWGESKPAASNATEEGRKANRRLTITLIPVQG